MKILLVANYKPDQQESMARYALWLATAIRSSGHEVDLIAASVHAGRAAPWMGRFGKWLGYIDKFLIFPWALKRRARVADVVHVLDHGNAMYVRYLRDRPHVVTCHDLLAVRCALGDVPGMQVGATGRLFQRLIRQGLENARNVVCVSRTTLDELHQVAPALRSEPVLIENPLNWPYRPVPPAKAWDRIRAALPGLCSPFLLHIGGNQWYKNRPGVVRIFKSLRKLGGEFASLTLVMAGKPFYSDIDAELTPDVRPHVLPLVNADNQTLQALYSTSEALLFPSLAEGFGWPIVEAQACGTLVITSDRGPMNQIAGEGSILIAPDDPDQAAKAIAAAWSRRAELKSEGARNVARFSPETAIQKYLHVYERVAAPGANPQ